MMRTPFFLREWLQIIFVHKYKYETREGKTFIKQVSQTNQKPTMYVDFDNLLD